MKVSPASPNPNQFIMKTYKFAVTYTDTYYYEIPATNDDDAFDKLSAMDRSEAEATKNLDITTELLKVEEDPKDEEDAMEKERSEDESTS